MTNTTENSDHELKTKSPDSISIFGTKTMDLKYGENGWQTPSAVYLTPNSENDPLSFANFKFHIGNPGYVNVTDVNRLLQTITHIAAGFDLNFENVPLIAVGAKHGNPCGAAYFYGDGPNSEKFVLQNMLAGDPISIFGGAVIVNFEINKELAEILITDKEGKFRPLDIIIAGSVTDEALEILKRKNDRCWVMTNPALGVLNRDSLDKNPTTKYIRGGFIHQPNYTHILDLSSPDIKHYGNLNFGGNSVKSYDCEILLAWGVGATSNSNTITIAKKVPFGGMIIANAAGRQDRVGAAQLALSIMKRAGHRAQDSAAAYSDSFFPFPDGPKVLLDAGVRRIFASSGSKNDKNIIALYENLGYYCQLDLGPDNIFRGFSNH